MKFLLVLMPLVFGMTWLDRARHHNAPALGSTFVSCTSVNCMRATLKWAIICTGPSTYSPATVEFHAIWSTPPHSTPATTVLIQPRWILFCMQRTPTMQFGRSFSLLSMLFHVVSCENTNCLTQPFVQAIQSAWRGAESKGLLVL